MCGISGAHRALHRGKVVILMYHRVLRDDDEAIPHMQPGMYVTESSFERQMGYVSANYEVISVADLILSLDKGGLDPGKRYCIVTFDDGWRDNFLHAYPVMKRRGIQATIFLTTGFIGTGKWFWHEKARYLFMHGRNDAARICRELLASGKASGDIISSVLGAIEDTEGAEGHAVTDAVVERLKAFGETSIEDSLKRIYEPLGLRAPDDRVFLNWHEVEEMSKSGISFGSHTRTHRLLTTLAPGEAREELEGSLRDLSGGKINRVPAFCYPNGNLDDGIVKMVKECGYLAAFTTSFGFEDALPEDPFRMKRIGVHNDVSSSIPLFAFHLSGLRHKLRL
ncbi:MAG: polysaccharide deacetylase family protein [Deltaproteobacteria bacterium]|nr:polysaccharide deacetylase family protein [Deltaproteobacteria bacterium]